MVYTNIDKIIIDFFLSNENKPTYAAEIAKTICANKSGVTKRCAEMKEKKVLTTTLKYAKRRGNTDHYSLVNSVECLKTLYEHIPNACLMSSSYYQNMIPEIVNDFEKSLPRTNHCPEKVGWKVPNHEDMKDNVEYMRDTCNMKINTPGILSPEDRMNITDSLKSSVSALKFVFHFLSLDSDNKDLLITDIECDLIDTQHAPDVAHIDGYMECIDDMALYVNIPEEILKSIYTNLNKQRQHEPKYFWSSFFNMLDVFGAQYPFLFE